MRLRTELTAGSSYLIFVEIYHFNTSAVQLQTFVVTLLLFQLIYCVTNVGLLCLFVENCYPSFNKLMKYLTGSGTIPSLGLPTHFSINFLHMCRERDRDKSASVQWLLPYLYILPLLAI